MTPNDRAPDSFEERFLSGRELWGDAFGPEDVAAWFDDEIDAYAELVGAHPSPIHYAGINLIHGFRHLPPGRLGHVLGLGSADGAELSPIIDRIDDLTIVEATRALDRTGTASMPLRFVAAHPDGSLPFESGSLDLVICLGVLHHIANVTFVLAEIGRVLRDGGMALVREPTHSMGDWRNRRAWATKRERGIPIRILRSTIRASGLEIVRERRCMFPTTERLGRITPRLGQQTVLGARLDQVMSVLFAWNDTYHARHWYQRLSPRVAFFVLRRA